MTDILISTEQLVVGRGGMALTQPLDLSLARGTIWQLTGPNGVGKTSLLRVLAGLLPALLGELRHGFGGPAEAVRAFDPFWMAQIGWLAVQPGLKPGPTVAEHLRRTARLAGLPAVADDALLARWGLTPLRDRPVQYLSQGQRRRVDLARLCQQDRPIWVLDEPTVTLDADARDALMTAIGEHRERGGLTVLASHEVLPLDDIRMLDLAVAA